MKLHKCLCGREFATKRAYQMCLDSFDLIGALENEDTEWVDDPLYMPLRRAAADEIKRLRARVQELQSTEGN